MTKVKDKIILAPCLKTLSNKRICTLWNKTTWVTKQQQTLQLVAKKISQILKRFTLAKHYTVGDIIVSSFTRIWYYHDSQTTESKHRRNPLQKCSANEYWSVMIKQLCCLKNKIIKNGLLVRRRPSDNICKGNTLLI